MKDVKTPATVGITGMIAGFCIGFLLMMKSCEMGPADAVGSIWFWLAGGIFSIVGGIFGWFMGGVMSR